MAEKEAFWWQYVDCQGRTALDLGGYSGGWGAKAALEHGAVSAIVVDNGEWRQYGWAEPPREHPAIQYVDSDLMDWKEPSDIVIAGDVIYHMKDPFAGLAHLHKLTKERLLMRTSTVSEDEADKDGWKWYPDGMGHENGTVWCRPSPSGFLRAVTAAGFKDVQEIPVYGSMTIVASA